MFWYYIFLSIRRLSTIHLIIQQPHYHQKEGNNINCYHLKNSFLQDKIDSLQIKFNIDDKILNKFSITIDYPKKILNVVVIACVYSTNVQVHCCYKEAQICNKYLCLS